MRGNESATMNIAKYKATEKREIQRGEREWSGHSLTPMLDCRF